jgi:pimeloyl-ACP methyl ester carboxylesterase
MSRLRRIATLLAISATAIGLTAGGASAAPAKVAWTKCHSDLGPFQCGTVQVPLDYDQPNGATISLALVRLPASDPAHRIGSLFLNPGGPGGSGVDFALFAGPFLYNDSVRAHFDLVGFDPRGIGRSTALRCFGTSKQWGPYFTPFAFPSTSAEEVQWMNADLYLDSSCAQRGGNIADHMSTANVARDLDQLRQVVGDEQLTYAGVSYGTMIGQTYANMFPGNVRAIIIDGVLDPIAWTTGSGDASTVPFSTRLHSDIGAQATLQEFFRLCDAGTCAFGPNSAARFQALADYVKVHPLVLTNPDGSTLEINYSILISATLGAMYDSLSWEDFAGALADLEAATAAPATPRAAKLGARLQAYLGVPSYIAKRGFPHYSNQIEGFPAVACADSDNPDSYSAWSAAGVAADATGYFGRLWTWASSICAAWPRGDSDRYSGPWNTSTANPVLVIGNQFDPATRYQGAVTAAALLPNSRLLTVHAWGHTSLFRSQCADEVAADYLVNLVLPPEGTVCEQDHVPFSGP